MEFRVTPNVVLLDPISVTAHPLKGPTLSPYRHRSTPPGQDKAARLDVYVSSGLAGSTLEGAVVYRMAACASQLGVPWSGLIAVVPRRFAR